MNSLADLIVDNKREETLRVNNWSGKHDTSIDILMTTLPKNQKIMDVLLLCQTKVTTSP